jgi:manganese transport system substrate-binding protein
MPKSRSLSGLAAALAAGLLLSGCANPFADDAPATASDASDRPVVLTTFTVLADLVAEVGGDAVEVRSITRAGAEIHGYEPTPSDLVAAQDADLILDNGLGLEGWFAQFTAGIDAPRATLSDGVEEIPIGTGEYAGRVNPHAWMSPRQAAVYVDNAVSALSALAPASARVFEENGADYKAALAELETRIADAVATVPEEQRMLVTCEGAFSYLARDAGLEEASLWAVNQERQGTPQQTAAVVDVVRERGVPAVFCESTVSDAAQRQVALETGATLAGPLYVDSLTLGEPVPTLLDLLEHDIDTIVEALS